MTVQVMMGHKSKQHNSVVRATKTDGTSAATVDWVEEQLRALTSNLESMELLVSKLSKENDELKGENLALEEL